MISVIHYQQLKTPFEIALYQQSRVVVKEERKLFTLPSRYGGLAIPIFHKETKAEYNNSRRNTTELTRLI